MNAVLQCLGHIDLVVEYFVLEKRCQDAKQKKRLFKSKKSENFAKGKLTNILGALLRSLWSFGYSKELCQAFKDVVSKHGEQYRGTAQQDAQEFLLWLLNCIHLDHSRSALWPFHNKTTTLKVAIVLFT